MARLAGMEEIAGRFEHVATFYTITCPSRMHCTLFRGNRKNPRFDGTTPRQAQAYLRRQWARARAKLQRLDVQPYGFRIAEPQHDGTPHWHILLFCPSEDARKVTDVLRHYALQIDGDEPGASKYRFDAVKIDPSKGTATGYIAKYVSKNIDAAHLPEGETAKEAAERVEAWASTWRIRQFQQIGGPPVSVYRELRRLAESVSGDQIVEAARESADKGDWAGYMMAQGGPSLRTSECPVRLMKAWSDREGMYGEPIGDLVIGVDHDGYGVQTRYKEWTIEFDSSPTMRGLIAGRPAVVGEAAQPGPCA